MKIKKISQPLEVESYVIDSLESNSATNAPSIHAVNEELKDAYSTEEVKTNKVWIDGKPIYRRTFAGTLPELDGNWQTLFQFIGFQTVTEMYGTCAYGCFPRYSSDAYYVDIQADGYNMLVIGKGYSNQQYILTIEYTKATD